MKLALLSLAITFFSSVATAEDVFPIVPVSGMQLKYELTGVNISKSTDRENISRIRSIQGTLTGDRLKLSGTFDCSDPNRSELLLEIAVDDVRTSLRFPDKEKAQILKAEQAFELEVPIGNDAKRVTVSLTGRTTTVLGARDISVVGEFLSEVPGSGQQSDTSDQAPQEFASVLRVTGLPELRLVGDEQSQPLETETPVLTGATINTGSEATVLLKLNSGELLFLDHDSELVARSERLLLNKGMIKLQRERSTETTSFETSDYAVEFIGERLSIELVGNETRCHVIEGTASLTQRSGTKNSLIVRSGVRAFAKPKLIYLVERIDLESEKLAWTQLGFTNASDTQTDSPKVAEVPDTTSPDTNSPAAPATPPTSTPSSPPSNIPIELPDDGSMRIITLDTVGGYTPPRVNKEPELVIFADGRVIITDPFGKLPKVTRRLNRENLEKFLDFVVNQHHYYDLSTEQLAELEKPVRAQKGGPEIADIPTSIVRIGIRNMTYEVRCRGAEFLSEEYPEVEPFRDFHAIEARLRKFIDASREWAEEQKRKSK